MAEMAMVNTFMGASGAGLFCIIFKNWIMKGFYANRNMIEEAASVCNAMIAGMVAVGAGCNNYDPWAGWVTGIAAEKVIPDGFEAATGDKVAKESQAAIGEFLDIIKIFLLVFAGIAVLVGGFIIVNTFSILVAQRTRELALMRALGALANRSPAPCCSRRGAVLPRLDDRDRPRLGARPRAGRAVPRDRPRHRRQRPRPDRERVSPATRSASWSPWSRRTSRPVAPAGSRRSPRCAPTGHTRRLARRRATLGAIVLRGRRRCRGRRCAGAPGSDALWVGIGR